MTNPLQGSDEETQERIAQVRARTKEGDECMRLAVDLDRKLTGGGPVILTRSSAFSIRNALVSAAAEYGIPKADTGEST